MCFFVVGVGGTADGMPKRNSPTYVLLDMVQYAKSVQPKGKNKPRRTKNTNTFASIYGGSLHHGPAIVLHTWLVAEGGSTYVLAFA